MSSHTEAPAQRYWPTVLGATGVVYGDIGTSPLYTLKAALEHAKQDGASSQEVVGIISLLIWALIFIVTAKYVLFLMRADNRGEGGILSLMALAQDALGKRTRIVFLLGLAGAALFSGDAIITPAISVLSAVEGLELPAIQQYFDFGSLIIPISVAILVALFVTQSSGTARVAAFFGPLMLVFFLVIALLGLLHIFDAPDILFAINPLRGLSFLFSNGWNGFTTLGLVFLAVTGAEALYADMGHFGRKPIQLAWVALVLPALMLNYLGQGALVLNDLTIVQGANFNPFYQLAPEWATVPVIILSTMATVIASQAVITGAFSLVRQAIQLGLLPRVEIQHTSDVAEGQIYIPRVNRTLLFGVIALVLVFRSSDALANAYGIAVTGTMLVTTTLAYVVVRYLWHWSQWRAAALVGCFLVVDAAFFAANLMKVLQGGWILLMLGGISMLLMSTWVRGMSLLAEKTRREAIPTQDFLRILERSKPARVPGTGIFLTGDTAFAPRALMHNLKHNKVLHERIIFMNVKTENVPRVTAEHRLETRELSTDVVGVIVHYGYMESPRIPAVLALLRKNGMKLDIMSTSFFVGRRALKRSPKSRMPVWQDSLFIALSKQAANATDYFAIPSDRVVELGAQVTI